MFNSGNSYQISVKLEFMLRVNIHLSLSHLRPESTWVFHLQLDGSRSYEQQWVAVPDVDVHGVKGQVAKEPALLPWPQETIVYSELHLQTWRAWTRGGETSDQSK